MDSIFSKLPLNFNLLKTPANWLTIFVMVSLVTFAFAVISAQISNKDNSTNG